MTRAGRHHGLEGEGLYPSSMLWAAVDVTLGQGDIASRTVLVPDERPAGLATTRAPARPPGQNLFCSPQIAVL